jgi:glycosyltransferase involved in cell wall biosynthesis
VASQPLSYGYFLKCVVAARNADIVHLHAPNMLGALCSLLIPKKTRLLVHWHSDVIGKGTLAVFLRPLEAALLRRADCVVTTSQAYAGASVSLAPFKKKVTVVPIGVPGAKPLGKDFVIPSVLQEQIADRKIILAVGRLVPYKGFDVLIASAKRLADDAVVVIVGTGPLQAELHQAAVRAGVKDRVLFAGSLGDTALHALFQRSTLYCLPSTSRSEAFGVVLLEAMSYGLPIVATDIAGSGVPWVNQHGLSGFNVPVRDPEALAEACNLILGSGGLHAKLAKGARNRFLMEFTEDVSVTRIMAIYNSLLSA